MALPALPAMGYDMNGWKAALIAACMAGLSAVKTLITEIVTKHNHE